MAKQGSFANYLLIVVFAAGVVAIGARELNRPYARHGSGSNTTGRELVKELHGEVDMIRASAGNAEVESSKGATKSEYSTDVKPTPTNTPKSSKSSDAGSKGEDKEQLQKVIDDLVP